jgi:hypothetical protein
MKFTVSHLRDSRFDPRGLRAFFEYRDLGIAEATDGKVVAHVIRAKPGAPLSGGRHHHDVEFQLVYVLRGWCTHEPPGIRHTELGHSDDLELLEIVMPADFETVSD